MEVFRDEDVPIGVHELDVTVGVPFLARQIPAHTDSVESQVIERFVFEIATGNAFEIEAVNAQLRGIRHHCGGQRQAIGDVDGLCLGNRNEKWKISLGEGHPDFSTNS